MDNILRSTLCIIQPVTTLQGSSNLLKVGLLPSKKSCFTCFHESHLKMKNAFYFTLFPLFSFSRYLNFSIDFLGKM